MVSSVPQILLGSKVEILFTVFKFVSHQVKTFVLASLLSPKVSDEYHSIAKGT